MKTLLNPCAAATLALVLYVPATAGEITTWVVAPPPPPPPASAMTLEPTETATNNTQSATDSDSLLTEITVSLWQLHSLF